MRKALCTFVLLPLLLLGVACGGSDDKDAKDSNDATTSTTERQASSSTSTTTSVLPVDEIDAGASPYCADWKVLRSGKGVVSTGDKAKDQAARRAYYGGLVPTVEKLVSDADATAKPDAQKTLEIIRKAASTGDAAVFETDEARALQGRLAVYAEKHCTK